MNDLESRARVASRIDPRWQCEDIELQLERVHRRYRRRARRRLAGAVAAVALCIAVGSRVMNTSADRLDITARTAPRAPDAAATASTAPSAAVEEASRRDPPRPDVDPPAQRRGDPPPPASHRRETSRVTTPAPLDDPRAAPPIDPGAWRLAAERGDYAGAWTALERAGAPLERMDDLLLAADVARLSGHADAAIAHFARAIERHARDPRAPLAAFTLGRMYLEDLGTPREAALAFANAVALAPGGPLAEDALAREVEAWSRAGETETARVRAAVYLQHYPQGRRIRAVRRFGGLEAP